MIQLANQDEFEYATWWEDQGCHMESACRCSRIYQYIYMKIWLYHCFPSVNFVDKLIGIKDNFLHKSCSSIWGDSIQIYFIYLGAIISWLWISKFGRSTSTKQENQLSLVSYGGRCGSLQGRDLSVAAGALQRGMAVALRRWRRETTRRMKSGATARCWLTEDDFGWRSQLWTSGGWPSACAKARQRRARCRHGACGLA
jgi:hypothetical protein